MTAPTSKADPSESDHLGIDASWSTEGTARRPAQAQPPSQAISEPARETPVHDVTDVLVVGGGPAGCAAAVAAARLGAKVTLVERYNHLGGLSTGGLVIWIDRMSDWQGNQVIAGFASEILERMPAGAVAGAPPEQWGSTDPALVAHWHDRASALRGVVTWSPMIDPEWLKFESLQMLDEAGVRLLLHSWVVDAIGDGRELRGVIFESKQGRRAILAKVVVDCSGDLDVAAAAGVPYESDLVGAGSTIQHCVNTSWTWAGIDFQRWQEFTRSDPDGHRALVDRGQELLGYLETPVVAWRDDVVVFMGPRLTGYRGIEVDDLTAVELESRRRMVAHLDFYRRHAPGFENAWLLLSAPQAGIRHTRRLIGVHKMTIDEWRTGVRPEDEVGISPSPSDKFAPISVPLGCLVAADLDNVLAAGRHIATDQPTQAFMREIPQCWLTGQAAGAAAALSAGTDVLPRELDPRELRRELQAQGVHLHPGGR
ncbi:MAG TPA: FAD-dependent oxidoreductase [Solirubrobacterales bacterium]|nr:FAD-dependent oxidoreductase [Solirubrobacterales bacterium]